MQAQTETQHAQIEKDSCGHYQPGDDVHPLLAERTRMRMGGQDGVGVYLVQDNLVASVRQVFYHFFQTLANLTDGLIVTRTEEDFDGVGPAA